MFRPNCGIGQSPIYHHQVFTSSVKQLLDALGPSSLRLIAAPRGGDVPVSGTLIHEPRAPLPRLDGALLLAVGTRPARPQAEELVRRAAEAGFAGVVVKRYGEPVTELAAVAEAAGAALLSADEDLTWQQLDALVSSALSDIACTGPGAAGPDTGDLFALANAIAGAVGGAMAIEDPHQRILAYSTLEGQPIDEDRRQGILGLHVPYAPVNEEQYRLLARTNGVCRFPAEPGGLARMAVAVRAGGELLGSLWVVDADDDLGEDAERALDNAAHIAALHLLRARTAHDLARRRRGDLLRRVLEDPASATVVAPQLGMRPDASAVVAAFLITSDDPEGVVAARAALQLTDLVSLHCEAHYGRHGCALIGGTVYALLPAGSPGAAHRKLITDIASRARRALRVPVRAALGSVVTGLRAAAKSRDDADAVLRALASREEDDPGAPAVATIDDVRPSVALAELAELSTLMPRLSEGAGPVIRAHDREHGTSYGDTLLAYFASGGDISATARRLNVHPNTCRYRLGRAEEIFGLTLGDADARLFLWLQLRLT
ncbi:hypothetical protein ABH927_005535 [Planotetraspora sp. GP83]